MQRRTRGSASLPAPADFSPSFSTRGVSDPGRGSKWTSCLKGLHYKSVSLSSGLDESEGQVKYCRCTFFGYATPDRAGARPACRVARCDIGSQPTPLIPFWRLFACFAGPFLRQSGVVTETQLLIGLRVLCGLLWICSSSSVAAMPWTACNGWSLRLGERDLSCRELFLMQPTDSQCGGVGANGITC